MRKQHLNRDISHKSDSLLEVFNRFLDEHGVEKSILTDYKTILFDAKFLLEKSESIPAKFKLTKNGYKLEFLLILDIFTASKLNLVNSMHMLEKVVPFKFYCDTCHITTAITAESRTNKKISFSKLSYLVKRFIYSRDKLLRMH